MAPRRSNAAGPSQPAQAQRSRRQEEAEQSPTSEDNDVGSGDEQDAATQAVGKTGLGEAELKIRAAQLIRFALGSEYKHQLIRRENVVRQIIPQHSRAFDAVVELANQKLKHTFGMELFELPKKTKGDAPNGGVQAGRKGKRKSRLADVEEADEEEEGNEDEPATQRKSKAVGSKTYILRTTIPQAIVAAMANPKPLPMFGDDGDALNNNDDEPTDSGALINWEKADGSVSGHVAMVGIRTVILCLVLGMGRVVQDDHLHALLRRLNLDRETILPYSAPDGGEPLLTLDKFLDLLAKQGYLDKIRIPSASGVPEEASWEWRWGVRGAEFSEKAAAQFIEQIFFAVDASDEESSEEEDQPNGRRAGRRVPLIPEQKRQAREKLRKNIEKAAGGPLMGWS